MYESASLDRWYPAQDYFYVEQEVEIQLWDFMFIKLGLKSNLFSFPEPPIGVSFFPYNANYEIGGGLRFGKLELGFRHYCIHPVMPWVGRITDYKQVWEGWYEELYVRFSNRR